jgi:AraC-like DNA-binding protein
VQRLLPRVLITYVIMLILPILFGTIAYRSAQSAITRNAEESRMAALRQALTILDFSIGEARDIANTLSLNSTLRRFAYLEDPYEGVNPIRIIETLNEFRRFNVRDPLIVDFFVVLRASDVAIGPQRVSRISRFYPDLFRYEGWSLEQWRRRALDDLESGRFLPSRRVTIADVEFSLISYSRPFPFAGTPTGVIVVLIDAGRIDRILSDLAVGSRGLVVVRDETGQVITRVPSSPDGETDRLDLGAFELSEAGTRIVDSPTGRMLATVATSSDSGWSIGALEPVDSAMAELAGIQRTTVVVVVLTLVVGGALAAAMAYQSFKPVRLLIDDNEALREAQEHQLPFLRHAFYERLFRGEFESEAGARRLMDELDLRVEGGGYCVALVQTTHAESSVSELPYSEVQRERLVLADLITRAAGEHRVVTHEVAGDRLAVLVVSPPSSDERIDYPRVIDYLYDETRRRLPRAGRWGVGTWHNRLLDVARSFGEAQAALAHASGRGSVGIISYAAIPRRGDGYSYPGDVENRLIGLVSSGNVDETRSLVAGLVDDNVTNRHPSSVVVRLFAYDLLSTALKIVDGQSVRDVSIGADVRERLTAAADLEPHRACEAAMESLCRMAESAAKAKRSHNTALIREIESYLEANYGDPSMGLYAVASRFGISETYLSHFFKEQTGINFATRLQALRIKEAANLLVKTAVPVKEVARRVGYGTYTTFARVFRTTYGMSASEYRETHSDCDAAAGTEDTT